MDCGVYNALVCDCRVGCSRKWTSCDWRRLMTTTTKRWRSWRHQWRLTANSRRCYDYWSSAVTLDSRSEKLSGS